VKEKPEDLDELCLSVNFSPLIEIIKKMLEYALSKQLKKKQIPSQIEVVT